MFAQHPMVPLLAIWLRLLTWLPPKKWVPLLAIRLHLLTWLPPKKNGCTTSYGCATSYGSAPGNMVASVNLATAKKMDARPPMVAQPPMAALKTEGIQTINWSHVGINRCHHHQTPSNLIFLATAKKNGCATSYGCVTSYGCAKHGQNTDYKLITCGN